MAIINRETDYALRVLRSLCKGEKKSVNQICQEEKLPPAFSYKIIKKMQRANLIEISYGAKGGCRLICNLKEVSLYDLMRAIEEEQIINACFREGFACDYAEGSICTVHRHLQRLQDDMDAYLKRCSLADFYA